MLIVVIILACLSISGFVQQANQRKVQRAGQDLYERIKADVEARDGPMDEEQLFEFRRWFERQVEWHIQRQRGFCLDDE
jgi:hypothetical protein